MSEERKHENPYVGPRTFSRAESTRFFGRELEGRNLFSLVMSERLVLFYAQSGAGKSSLINTRLIPQLEMSDFLVLPVGRVSGELPQGVEEADNIFTFNLMLSLDQSDSDPNAFTRLTLSEFLAKLTSEEGEIFYYDAAAKPEQNKNDSDNEELYVLIIDQFEEIISTHQERWQEREEFFRQLNQAMHEDPSLWVVLTLREDYVAALDPYAHLLKDKMRARFYMKRMGVKSALEAIQKPAELYGRTFAPGVANILVENLRQIRAHGSQETSPGEFIEPVQLQVVCYQLWENLRGHPQTEITQQDLDELGDVDTALSQFYEDALGSVMQKASVSEIALRSWFDQQLITKEGTRGIIYQGTEETAGMSNDVVNLLASQFLLRAEIRAGGTWYELVHDRFVNPILTANQAWRIRQSPLIQAAEAWNRSGRNRSLLYQDEQLKQVLATIERESQENIVQELLLASEEAQSQRDLAVLQAQAEEERQRAEEQQRRAEAEALAASRLRRLSVALAFVFIIAVVAAVFAVILQQEAKEQEAIAFEAKATAEAASTVAVQERDFAAAERDRANQNEKAALAAKAEAEEQRDIAATAQAQAEEERDRANENEAAAVAAQAEARTAQAEAERQRDIATEAQALTEELKQISQAQLLAATAPQVVARSNDTELATLLAIEAYHLNLETEGNAEALIDSSLRQLLSPPFFNTKLTGHRGGINAVEFSPDGNFIVTASDDTTIRIWDLLNPENRVRTLEGHTEPVIKLAFSEDGRWLASTSEDDTVRLWDYTNKVTAESTLPHGVDVLAVAFRPEIQELATGDANGRIVIWDISDPDSPAISSEATIHDGPIFAMAYYDRNTLISASRQSILWHSANNLENIPFFIDSSKGFTGDIALSSGKQFLAVATEEDHGLQFYDILQVDSTPEALILGHEGPIRDLAFVPNSNPLRLVSTSNDRTVRLWRYNGESFAPLAIISGHQDNISSVAVAPDGSSITTASEDQTLRLWDITAPPPAAPIILADHEASVQSVAYSKTGDNELLISASDNGRIIIRDKNGIELSRVIKIANSLSVNDAGTVLAASGGDRVQLWNISNPSSPVELNAGLIHDSDVHAIAFVPGDNGRLVSGDDNGSLYLWDISNPNNPLGKENEHDNRIGAIAIHPNGNRLVSGDQDGTLHLWLLADDVLSLRAIREAAHTDLIRAVAFSSDGQWLASASEDATIRFWDGNNVDEFVTYPEAGADPITRHEEAVTSLSFSPTTSALASGSRDQTIRIWNLDDLTATPIVLTGHRNEITAVAYSLDGEQLASVSEDQTVWIQVATVERLIGIACQQVRRLLTPFEWEVYLPGEIYAPFNCGGSTQ